MRQTAIEQSLFGAFLLAVAVAFSTNVEVHFTLPKLFWMRAIVTA